MSLSLGLTELLGVPLKVVYALLESASTLIVWIKVLFLYMH
jgi:hypothetical protein